jgi:hypothetical protein
MTKRKKGFEKGKFKKGDKPSDYAGGWENNPITIEEIRKRAWPRTDNNKQ